LSTIHRDIGEEVETMTSHRFLLKSEPRAISWKTLLACIAGCGPRIGNGAYGRCVRGHIANGVDQVPQFIGNAILLQIRNVVTQTQECGMRIDRLSRRRPLPAQEKHQIDILQRMLDWYDRHLN